MNQAELMNAVDAAMDFFERVKHTLPGVSDIQRLLASVSIQENQETIKRIGDEVIRLRAREEGYSHDHFPNRTD